MGSVPNNVACDERVIAPLGDTRTLAALAAPRLSAWQERKAEELMSNNLSGSADVKDIARSCRISRGYFVSAFKVRSEERRVGKECVSTCSTRWWPVH